MNKTPTGRPLCPRTEAPLFTPEDMASLAPSARELAGAIPPLEQDSSAALLDQMLGVGCPARLDFLLADHRSALEDLYATTGESLSAPLGVVPRAWVLRLRETDFGFMGERQDFVLEPTVIVASLEHLYWQEGGKWRALALRGDGPGSMHEWSELFGRGPFAHFTHEDLGLDPQVGRPEYFDLCLGTELNVAQSLYSFVGAQRDLSTRVIPEQAKGLYEALGMLEEGEGLALECPRLVRERLESRAELSGFLLDLGAMHWAYLSFMLQGAFSALLPRGLDPHGQESFRYPSIQVGVQAMGMEPLCDEAGVPLQALVSTRGMTLPALIEPAGRGGGRHLDVLVASLRNWWPFSGAQQSTGMSPEAVSGWRVFSALKEYSSCRPRLDGREPTAVPEVLPQFAGWKEQVSPILAAKRAPEETVVELQDLLSRSPENAEAQLELARALRRIEGRGEEAVAAADRACELHPCPLNHWIAAMARADLGDTAGRDEQIGIALGMWGDMPQLVRVWRRYSLLRAGQFGEEARNLENWRTALRLLNDEYPGELECSRWEELLGSVRVGDFEDSLLARAQMLCFDFPDEIMNWHPWIGISGRVKDAPDGYHDKIVDAAVAKFGVEEVNRLLDEWSLPLRDLH